jgi:DNA-binding MarR family transcriptional regulator
VSAAAHVAPQPTRAEALDEVQHGLAQLFGAERRLRGRDQHRTKGGLSHAHARALFAIGHGETTAGELARAAQTSPASVTAMLDELVADGIVVRRRSTTDRRQVLVALTDDGRALYEETRARWRAHWERALGELSGAELQAAATVMRTIADLLDDA